MRLRAERREIMQHPTRSTTIRIDDNAPRSCIYDDRRDGYCAGDREARYPHLSFGDTRHSCQPTRDGLGQISGAYHS